MKIHVDKISSSTKNVPLKHELEISKKIAAESGAIIAVKVQEDKKIYNQIELANGRFSTIHRDDILVVTLGDRKALKGFVGEVPEKIKSGDVINILNIGGVAGICTSANTKEVGKPLKVEVLGAVLNKKMEPLNIHSYKLFSAANSFKTDIPLIIVSGSCMNVGKTTVASEIIKAATRAGKKVCAAKVAGVAARKDTLNMRDYGAINAVSMIDAGIASTASKTSDPIGLTKGAVNFLAKDKPDYIVIELGDGIFGEYGVMDILEDEEIQDHISAHVGCASDPMSAAKMHEICKVIGTPLHVISGPVTDNSVGTDFIKKNLKIHAMNAFVNGDKIFGYLEKNVFNLD